MIALNAVHAEITWTLSDDGTMTISGTDMPDYYSVIDSYSYDRYTSAPWKYVREKIKEVVIKDGVQNIGSNAFYNCKNLTTITIPNSVTSIGNNVFTKCSALTSVTLPNTVTSIEWGAFENCSGLTSVTIPNSVTSIGNEAFYACSSLTSVTIPNSVISIGRGAFEGAGLTSITIPNSVTSIENNTFDYCLDLTSITIPNSITSIGICAFNYCTNLTSITIPNSVTSIGDCAFFGCSGLTSVTIPNSVTNIGYGTFSLCSGLTSVTISNSVTSIGYGAFTDCSGLTSITIPNSVTSIEGEAFRECSGLSSITCEASNPPSCDYSCFISVNKSIPVYVPANSIDAYKVANGWKEFNNIQSIIVEPTSISFAEAYENLIVGMTKKLEVTITPEDATNKTITWTSSNTDVATISSEGIVTAKGAGTTIITATTNNGKTAKCTITVEQPVTAIALSDATTSLWVGKTKTLTATVTPTTSSNTAVNWSSSNKNVATVSSKGVITAKGKGTCTITCTAADGYGTKSTCEVTVKQQVTEIALSEITASLWVGDTKTIKATATPTIASNTNVSWSSSDEKVATVSSKGVITAKGKGTCTITCTAADGYGTKSTCEVTVKQQVTEIAINETTVSLWVGDTKTITATASPTTASNTSINWTSSDENVATVSSEGVITANGEGTCIITCTASDGYGTKSTCEITIKQQVTEIALSETKTSLWVGDTKTITATASPTTASNTSVTWTSSDDKVASVSSEGVITANGEGSCIITCTATDGYGTKSTCEVTVKQQVTEIVLSETTVSLWVGETKTLSATVSPTTANNTSVEWYSSDDNVATVSSDGVITANGEGTCIITCTAADGYGTKSTCEITIKQQVTEIALSETNASLWVGDTKTLTATVSPTTANKTSVEWYSSDDNVASVSSEGVITANGEGTCIITCTAADGYGTKTTCEVTVKQQVTEIALSETNASLWVGETKTITATALPTTASNTSVEWSSSDDNVATISYDGVITAKGEGTCIITCTAADGYGTKSICEVTVKQQVTEIALSETNASLWVGDTKAITATALPTTASNTAVEWSSSDENVASVSSEGVITANGEGTCIITCTAADGYGTVSICEVTVMQQTTSLEDLRFANVKSPVYNLNGQRINKAHAQKGIYIKNGKKYANKN